MVLVDGVYHPKKTGLRILFQWELVHWLSSSDMDGLIYLDFLVRWLEKAKDILSNAGLMVIYHGTILK